MVEKIFNFIIYKIYFYSRKYLFSHNVLVNKNEFDFVFWGGSL